MKLNIPFIKNKLSSESVKAVKPASADEMCMLDHIEKIIEVSKKYGIDKCFSKGKVHFRYVMEKLNINCVQAVIFSHFMERSNENLIRISDVAEAIHCSIIRIIKYMNECEELEKRKLIRCIRNSDGTHYKIPFSVRESMRLNNELVPEKIDDLPILKLFALLARIFNERKEEELTYESMKLELLDLINHNMHLLFCQKIKSHNLDEDKIILLLCFCHLAKNNDDDNIHFRDLEFMYGDIMFYYQIEDALTSGKHIFFEKKLIECSNSDGFAKKDEWKLTEFAKKDLMSELNFNSNVIKDVILCKNIIQKEMFYNIRETNEIQKLASLLQEVNFNKICERLDDKGMRKGFACLFSGSPGTGKTETVYQIARETGRDIMMVDISDTKSMWYGESEKKIKEIFNSYREATEKSEITPILLINEADAIISKRKEMSSNNRSVDQTENAIQNIILQEIENLSGILIATSNLTQNMDNAFERRFLYKIKFDKPGKEGRKGIWKAMMPDLSESETIQIAEKFEMSGGQIENVARKIEVDSILNDEKLTIEKLFDYCKIELNSGFNNDKVIGFGM